ncbi:PLP-dependent transferase [Aspergillus ruber CBS 135680]|uniref:PLP-dependent transferase n=1 Tax=Aspergillus ruber (strain CBS 135680) TaxID=1388766 RepID=A0A017SE41_ASPRC|nr:PLP-dependent transferase [Aspergillus ruber CBS 135680]EYE95222.1 PLP-dependent transferase [Aspergillus ruber CBS 135680]
MSRFQNIIDSPPDAAFSLVEAYARDTFPQKVDLCPGFYRDENAQPWILPSVAQAKKLLHNDPTIDHEHLPLSGHPALVSDAQRLVFGVEETTTLDRIASIQTIGGTGANHLGALFLSKTLRPANVWIPDPSWIAHPQVWEQLDSSTSVRFYPYFDKKDHSLDLSGMVNTLRNEAIENDVVVLHGCAHNPTGIVMTEEQWEEIAAICAKKSLFPLIDLAYQAKAKVATQLERLQRSEITTTPSYGARTVSIILGYENIRRQWQQDLLHMSDRMQVMRKRLYELLTALRKPGSWDHLVSEKGMLSLTTLSRKQVNILKEKYHVYMLPSGRISVTGLTEFNVKYVAESSDSVIKDTAPL